MSDYDPTVHLDPETGEPITHRWCPVCDAPRARIERSGHVIKEVLAEAEGVVIDAELLIEIDEELGTQVFDAVSGSGNDIDTVLARFLEYGWGRIDRDGDMIRTDVTASEPLDAELRDWMRSLKRRPRTISGVSG